jgi:hypothetical protein
MGMPSSDPDTSFYIRASRAAPPGLAQEDERRSVYSSALVQFEELMGAARAASPQTLPLSLFYALSQAGRAIAAARLEGEWRLQGHGLESSDLDAEDLCRVRIRTKPTKKRRPDSFSGVCRATGAEPLRGSTTIGELWASLPGLEKLLPELEERKPLHVEVLGMGNSPLEDATKVRATVAPLQAKSVSAARKALAKYRCGSEAEVFDMQHIAPIHKFTGYGEGVAVWWPSGATDSHGHWLATGRLAPLDLYTEQHWLRPLLGGGTPLSDLMTWWALLHALSMLARYEPSAWARALAYDSSYLAAPLAELLRCGVELVPQLVLESLFDDEF